MWLIETLDAHYQVLVNKTGKMPDEVGFRAKFLFNQSTHLCQQADLPPYQFYLYYLPRKQIRAFGAVLPKARRDLAPFELHLAVWKCVVLHP
ncbi:MAG: hypothetical protein HC913_05990 [Microscillaceae bacterium]|nr:hypothetical protein [Microscillaceae bacterium]